MTALQRLLKYPHRAVFDTAPAAELALRVRHPAGAEWLVEDGVLLAAGGDDTFTYDLSSLTMGGLAAALQADGFEVDGFSGTFAGLSAAVLVEGRGREAESNGDRLEGFTNPLYALYGGYAGELREAQRQIGEALRQMVITQAEDEWLDLWGTLYNERRRDDEADADYAPRIPQEAFRIRVNALAIEQAIKDATGKDVLIEEPWDLMFRLDESQLSGSQRLYNGKEVGPHLIRPVAAESFDWTDVLAVIERNRAAGVLVLPPESRLGSLIDASIAGIIWSGRTYTHGALVPMWVDSRLDYLILSGEEITRNWPVMLSQLISTGNADPLLNPYSLSLRRTIAKASIVLSEGPALGDENAVLPRSMLTQRGGEMAVSDDLELSSSEQRPVRRPVDFISTALHARGELDLDVLVEAGADVSDVRGAFVVAAVEGVASGIGISTTHYAPPLAVFPAFVWQSNKGITGLTWLTAGEWSELPWNISLSELESIMTEADQLDTYVNTTLPQHLAAGPSVTANLERTIAAGEELNTYVEDRLSEDLN